MQVTKEIFSFRKKNTQIYITSNWIDLTTDVAFIPLIDEEKEQFVALKSDKRKKEFLLVRFLRNQFFPDKEITYTSIGAPYFKDKTFSISISHTSSYVALAVSKENRIGIDLELIQEKIIPLGQKFMHHKEILAVQSDTKVVAYTHYWCAKEALYKWTNINGLSFQNDLSVIQDETKNWYGISQRISQQLIPLEMIEFKDHILCFTY